MLYVAKAKGIRMSDFCESIGQTYGNYKGENIKSAVSSEVLVRLLTIHPDISADFILRGVGEPIITGRATSEEPRVGAIQSGAEEDEINDEPQTSETIQLLKSEVAYLRELILKRDEQLFELVQKLTSPSK